VPSSPSLPAVSEEKDPMTHRVSATRSFCLLLAILILGGYLRFHGAEQRGPSFFDEGIYTLEGKWIYTFSKALASTLKRKMEEVRLRQNLYSFEGEARRFQESIEGEPPVWGRPGFSLLTGICMGLLGPRINATHLVSAFFGTLSILGVFLLGRAMFDDRVGLLAALLLAISGYHLVYSVTGLADGPAMCFALFAFYLYYKSKIREGRGRGGYLFAVLAGVGCGVAFAVHDRMLYVFLVLLLNEGIDFIRGKDQRKKRLKKIAVLGSAFLLPIGLFEFPYYLGMIILRHFGKTLPFRTYFEELFTHHIFNFFDFFAVSLLELKKYPEFQDAGSRLWNFVTYPYLFMRFDGVVFCLLFLAGSAAAFLQRRYEDRLLWVWLLVPFFLFSTGLSANVRYALVFMPAAFLIAARSLWLLDRLLARKALLGKKATRVVAVALPVIVFLSGWVASREIRQMKCTYSAPIAFLKANGTKHISLQYPVTKAYLGPENVKEPPFTWEQLEADYREGYRYYLIDFRKFFLKPPFGESEKGEIIANIESTIPPVFTYVHPCYTSPCYLFEVNAFFCLTRKIVREAHERGIDQIQIYDLQEYFRKKEVP
jgi:4-amino-4-deoxy-L-arabinose transferase-like glycosyltransferase